MGFSFKEIFIKLGLKKPPLPICRKIIIGNVETTSFTENESYTYPNNYVKSSRYTVINFLPKNLFEQFQRIANFYFLCIALIQLFIQSSVPIAMNIFPLIFVIVCTMVKQGYEDVLRHLADRDVNRLPVNVIRNGTMTPIRAENIEVGDIVRCANNDTLPCDLVLLSSSEPNGICYATTASLDGETNLKLFLSTPGTESLTSCDLLHNLLHSIIVCEQPTEDLYQFHGHIASLNDPAKIQPLIASNILLRGATIRNTEFIFGCAVYTGPDTKMALNSCEKMAKYSQVELRLNFFLAVFLIVLLSCGALCTALKYVMIKSTFANSFYITPEDASAWRVVQTFLSFIVLFNYLIPISLYVTIELQKFCGSKFFGWDLNMYDHVNDIAAKANTSDLNEELGQVEFLFSDKTGTLTENEMKFRQCSIDGIKFYDQDGVLTNVSDLDQLDMSCPPRNIERFFTVLSLCHTVRVEKVGDKEEYQAASNSNNNNPNLDNIMNHVTDYAMVGLRTLVIGTRRLTNEQYDELNNMHIKAQSALVNRDDMLQQTYDAFESELTLLGCTGIEDKLQEQVKETIEDLRDAGIQIWILTGDKEETAVNISHSTGHFSSSIHELRVVKQTKESECFQTIDTHIECVSLTKGNYPDTQFGLIIDGQSLGLALKSVMIDRLRTLCLQCAAVLCCRMTPLQKSEVVSLIKFSKNPAPVTAAIGDGANDVSMILEAHIGIGLFGKEGRQAVRAADYALARFRYLRNALLVHGHYYYIRIAILVQYFFYKNTAFIGPQFYFTFFSGFSAQTVYESLYLVLYNITLTSLPIFVYGLLEKHLPESMLLNRPKLYRNIRNNSNLRWSNFIKWNCFGLWHSVVAMFGPVLIFANNDIIAMDGRSQDFFYFGTLILLIVWITTSIKLCLVTYYWNIATLIGFLVTVFGNLGLLLIYQGVAWPNYSNEIYWVWFEMLSQPTTWLCVLIFVLISLTPDIIYKSTQDKPLWRKNRLTKESKKTYVDSVVFENRHNQINTSKHQHHQKPAPYNSDFDNGGFDVNNDDDDHELWQCSIRKSPKKTDNGFSNHMGLTPT